MRFSRGCSGISALVTAMLFTCRCAAQDPEMTPGQYTDSKTGINFTTWSAAPDSDGNGAFTFGIVLPKDALTKNATEYIGMLRCQIKSPDHTGWCGIAHAGHMIHDLLLMAWPYTGGDNNNTILTSFRWATDYFPPDPYTGIPAPSLTQISFSVNDTGYELLYRCQGCLSWAQPAGDGTTEAEGVGLAPTAVGGQLQMGHAQSFDAPGNAACPEGITVGFHDNGYGQWVADLAGAAREEYEQWKGLDARTVEGDCAAGASAEGGR